MAKEPETGLLRGEIRESLKCGDCGSPMQLKRGDWGLFWGCTAYPACWGLCSAHQSTGEPMGVPADAETRRLRHQLHQVFDDVWESGYYTRQEAYIWLADLMCLKQCECHIGSFTAEQCRRAIRYAVDFVEKIKASGQPVAGDGELDVGDLDLPF